VGKSLEPQQHIARADPRLAAVIARVGPPDLPVRRGRYATLVRAVIGQQVSMAAARSIYAKLRSAAGGYVTPERVGRLREPELRAVGLSRQKALYIGDLTARVADGSLRLDRLDRFDDDEVVSALTEVNGVGRWTAEMFLMFVLARPDVLPLGDLGIREGFRRVYRLRKPPTPARMRALAEPWRPYRSIGSWYLWRSLEIDPE